MRLSNVVAVFAIAIAVFAEDPPDEAKAAVVAAWAKTDGQSYVYTMSLQVKSEGAPTAKMEGSGKHKKGWWTSAGRDADGDEFPFFSDGRTGVAVHDKVKDWLRTSANDLVFGPTDAARASKLIESASWSADAKVGARECRVAKGKAAILAVKELTDGSGWNPANVILASAVEFWIDRKDGLIARARLTIEQETDEEGGRLVKRELVVNYTYDYAAEADFEVPKEVQECVARFGESEGKDILPELIAAAQKRHDAPCTFTCRYAADERGRPIGSWEAKGTHKAPWTRIEMMEPASTLLTDGKGCAAREGDDPWKKDGRLLLASAPHPDTLKSLLRSAKWGGRSLVDGIACWYAWCDPDPAKMAQFVRDCGLAGKAKISERQITLTLDEKGRLRRLRFYVATSGRSEMDGSVEVTIEFKDDPKADPEVPEEAVEAMK